METSESKVDGLHKFFLVKKFISTINGHLISFGGVFPEKIKVLLLILESYNAFVGVFHYIFAKKFFPLNQGHEIPKVRGV